MKYLSGWVQMCLIQIVIFLFAGSLTLMNDGSLGGRMMNGSTLAPLHALLILFLYYCCNPAAWCRSLSLSLSRKRGEMGGLAFFREWEGAEVLCVCVCVCVWCVCVCVCVCVREIGWHCGRLLLSRYVGRV